jgi:hypothetical protein
MMQNSRDMLRRLVDVAWQAATQSTEVPSTRLADKMINQARTSRYHWRRGFICGVVSSAGALFFGGLLGCIFAYLA